MKIIRVILFSLLALSLIVFTGLFIFFQTFDIDQYLPQITKKASQALGRPVSIGHLGLGFSLRGITLDAGPLTMADDPDFTTQPFIKVDRARVSLDLRPLILWREIHITGILMQSPQIHFIRSQQGDVNIRTIAKTSRSAKNNSKQIAASPSAPRNDIINKGQNLFSVIDGMTIRIQDASISFIDQSQSMPLDVWLRGINASLSDFSLSKQFQFSFNASPLVFKSISPGTPDSPIFKNITGIIKLNLAHLDLGAFEGVDANGDISITGGVIKNFNIIKTVLSHTLVTFGGMDGIVDKLGADDTTIEKAQAQFSLHDKTAFIDNFSIQTNIFELTAKGSVDQGLNMDMQTMLYLNKDVSAVLVNELEGLKFLYDDSKRIAIGAGLKGIIPHLKYKPNKESKKKFKNIFKSFLQ